MTEFDEGSSTAIDGSYAKKRIESDPAVNISGDEVIGRTPNGTVFKVPESHDMIHTLLDPRLAKTPADCLTVVILLSYVVLFWKLPSGWRTPILFLLFAFWRSAYNIGIGYLLDGQSKKQTLVSWAKKWDLFNDKKRNEPLQRIIAHDLKLRLPSLTTEQINELPIEYKTWIVFRHFVDLVLMSDFVSYVLLAISCIHRTAHPWYIVLGRIVGGLVLCLFNLWVKIDAHRVVKDFAWYWGDFFFLEDVNLTFDGVFELAPHPMYSIGYAAYYGVSLITASLTLFAASILAHGAQFYFLVSVESPHIEKTYGSPVAEQESHTVPREFQKATPRAMLIFKNFSFIRTSDMSLLAMVIGSVALYPLPRSGAMTTFTMAIAVAWRLVHTLGLGVLLRKQSDNQLWTKLHLKYGGSVLDAYQQWQAMYNMTTVMSYVTLIVFAFREIQSPFQVAYWPFRYILGLMLICLQLWTSYSIYEELGEYGWFFGDFFYMKGGMSLTQSGIYRYLNHPERVFGMAGVIGLASICCSSLVTMVAFLWVFANFSFIQFVEKPHILELYGEVGERESGVTKNIKQVYETGLINPGYIEQISKHIWEDYFMIYIEKLELLRPRVEGVVADTRAVLREYPAELTKILNEDISSEDFTGYSVTTDKRTYQLGEPIIVSWTSGQKFPRSARDWIGLYRAGDNLSSVITSKKSDGRWSCVEEGQFPLQHTRIIETGPTKGKMEFSGKLLFWSPGKYELRYHRNGKHNVLCISQPIEIVATPFDVSKASTNEIASSLIPLYARCSGKPLQPSSDLEKSTLNFEDNQVLARFTESIEEIYGTSVAPFVIKADATPVNIAERIKFIDRSLRDVTPKRAYAA